MDTERSHHSKGSSSRKTCDLFLSLTSCVSSSSSSMKLPSKCLFSPGRTKDSLTSSLSRRLKTSGSLKSGQGKASPMFPLFTKKRGSAFDNPEPSSPKVTCIGQVRVKTKKQGKKLRLRASNKRRRNHHQGELNNPTTTTIRSHSLRSQTQKQECLPHRNQRWVHLPMTICDAVRALGSSCVSPVRSCESSSCGVTSSSSSSSSSSCARWFVCLHEGDEKEREIEFVVGDEDEFERSQRGRRHVFEDIQIDESKMVHEQEQCVPPKNALLLMRCRSDPVKMSALVNRFCESPLTTDDDEDENEEEQNLEESKTAECAKNEVVYEKCVFSDVNEGHEIQVVKQNSVVNSEQPKAEIDQQQQGKDVNQTVLAEDTTTTSYSCTEPVEQNPENQECEEQNEDKQECEESENEFDREQDYDETGPSLCSSFLASLLHSDSEEEKHEENDTAEESIEEKKVTTYDRFQSDSISNIDNSNQRAEHQEKESKVLPECLLLMMYEPKLSMEVSKETWVCSTDFIRWLPRKQVKKSDSKDEPKKLVSTTESCKQQQLLQPRRSSCHYPSAAAAGVGCGGSMAAMIEQKLVKSNKGGEPVGLTRCKSEPMRSAAKLAAVQDACFFKNGLVGAAGRAGFEPSKLS